MKIHVSKATQRERLLAERDAAILVQRNASVALDELRDENERLRAALKEIRSLTAKHDLPDAWRIADRALQPRSALTKEEMRRRHEQSQRQEESK